MNGRAVWYFARFLVILAREIVLSSINVARLVLGPRHRLRSGFVALELDARTDLEIAMFANAITLTPGTITVYVDPRQHMLVMHALDTGDDVEALRQGTKATLEANVLRWTRAGERQGSR